MRLKMSKSARQELVRTQSARYQAAGRKEKKRILDELTAATGYNRKYAMSLLRPCGRVRSQGAAAPCERTRPQGRKHTYTDATLRALVKVWELSDRLCAKRLVPFLAEFIPALERHKELLLDDFTRSQLLCISAATADRHLQSVRNTDDRKGLCATRAGTLIKSQIPIRTFADWEEARPGFFEMDLVVHTDNTEGGAYLCTLVLTDVCTGWTECRPLLRRDAECVRGALQDIRKSLPFPLLGLDSDNGSEFINKPILAYCQQEAITFTRGRTARKNDQCYVEQKNGHIVRAVVGYGRYEGRPAYNRLGALYHYVNPWINFYQPSQKLVDKHREKSRVIKKYDEAKTPFTRCLLHDQITGQQKDALRTNYDGLNPVKLRRNIQTTQHKLWTLDTELRSDS